MVLKRWMLKDAVQGWRVPPFAVRFFAVLTRHYAVRQPEHVGMFAGSLLPHDERRG